MEQADRQLDSLRRVLAAILPANRFHAERLAASGLTANVSSLGEFVERCPFTTKADLVADQHNHPPYGRNLTAPLASYTRYCQTSGTTGKPLAILDTADSWNWMLENWAKIYVAGGMETGQSVYFAFSFGPFLGFWTAFESAARSGLRCLPGGGLGSAARVRAIVQLQADALCCTPTYALHLAEVASAEKINLGASTIRKIFVAGEPGGSIPAVRNRISELWQGAAVLDHYGMSEVGPVAFERIGHPGRMEVIEDSYFAEIVDPRTLAPTSSGKIGELVLTTLGRSACPLLRYRTGDLVRRAAGLGFVLDGGIIGRADDMVVVRGVNIYPTAIDAVVRRLPQIAEYQVCVSRRGEMTELSLRVESDDQEASPRLERMLTECFMLRIPVEHVAPNSLPRFELKARRWVAV